MDARQLFLIAHAHTHAFENIPGEIVGAERRLCEGLSEAQMRMCPFDRHNSIAWLLWHMVRCEDVMVNTMLRDVPEVLDDGWLPRLGVSTRHIGTEDTMAEVQAFSRQVNVAELRRYRAAVAHTTQAWVETVEWSSLDRILKCEAAERAAQRGALQERADWVRVMWGKEQRPEIWWLYWLAIAHNNFHLGEARVTRGLVEQQV
jgi:hypothetical protein